ncbi:glycoside hydrolase [Paenibacillus glucanolyticus]|uniref:Glycoside hydrolase n=1 Tax=Paenibacillus glucanolyticus TaxID=59843 RepID=A0A163JIV5_9BACL|nr:glycoside hydrolase family 43 protein [Paenibacillus glucanolyticus]KZS46610.1 glycoside hydrolase [Paenibacillus glucanolyticus]
MNTQDIQLRDPYILPDSKHKKYYMYGSTDKDIWREGNGFDVYISEDLRHWEGPCTVFHKTDNFFAEVNFWAPEVYEYHGRYIMFATFRRKDNDLLGTAVLSAEQPTGPFALHSSGPVTPADWSSLDGTLYIDEENQPWMVFCHEWQQVGDGEVCAMRLSPDLSESVSEPVILFRASEAAWTTPFHSQRFPGTGNYVTDGPFLFRTAPGSLLMLWASFVDGRYALGIAKSPSGSLMGPWLQEPEPLYSSDGGHGMVFRTWEGQLMLAVHTPNRTPEERPIFIPVVEDGDSLKVSPMNRQTG